MGVEGRIRIRAAETSRGLAYGLLAMNLLQGLRSTLLIRMPRLPASPSLLEKMKRNVLGLRWFVEDNREDIVLDLISASHAGPGVIVYGGLHNWEDNIERWNSLHPDKRFSLIEIIPRSYR